MLMPGDSAGLEGSSMGDMSLPTAAVREVVRIAPQPGPQQQLSLIHIFHDRYARRRRHERDIRWL